MGIDLVKASQQPEWAGLSLTARYVLGVMCATALDTPNARGEKPRRYFNGTGWLVAALTGATRNDPGYQAGKRKVERALSELRQAGAIKTIRPGRPGHFARYLVLPEVVLPGRGSREQ